MDSAFTPHTGVRQTCLEPRRPKLRSPERSFSLPRSNLVTEQPPLIRDGFAYSSHTSLLGYSSTAMHINHRAHAPQGLPHQGLPHQDFAHHPVTLVLFFSSLPGRGRHGSHRFCPCNLRTFLCLYLFFGSFGKNLMGDMRFAMKIGKSDSKGGEIKKRHSAMSRGRPQNPARFRNAVFEIRRGTVGVSHRPGSRLLVSVSPATP